MNKSYYLGLDIGTNSVGWAVTDENYKLCRFRKKNMWGIRLFEDALTAEDRRLKRSSRRRLARRNDRIKLLQEIFALEIEKVDPTFFMRLNESRLHFEDKEIKEIHPLFNDEKYKDKEYYSEYPTIFHLRKELINNKEEHDIRLVYLAIHHILKNRGHFLINGNFSSSSDFKLILDELLTSIKDTLGYELHVNDNQISEFENILKDKKETKTSKQKKIAKLVEYNKENLDKDGQKEYKAVVDNMCKFISGCKGDVFKFIGKTVEEVETKSFAFSESKYEESIKDNLEQVIPDEAAVIEKTKVLYDWSVLSDILGDEEFISFAKVESFNKHKENLKSLHYYLKKYCSKEVSDAFFDNREATNVIDDEDKKLISKLKNANYAAYVGSVKRNGKQIDVKRCAEEDFYKALKSVLESIEPETCDEELATILMEGTELFDLLPLQRSKDNGVVPKQIHEVELNRILDNASSYLDFLNETDENGRTIKDKIKSIFNYRIPYYVGPLSDRHKNEGSNVWMVRKKEGRIYPWNFDEMVDREKSNEEFIKRMTNKCTYLIGEDVLPKCSILYSAYTVLNELNNLRIKGHPISVELKQDIFKDLFMKCAKVTGKGLLRYLNDKDPGINLELIDLSGFNQNFNTSFAAYIDFRDKVFGEDIRKPEILQIAEDIIKWITIYDDDNVMLKNVIENKYPGKLTKEQLKAVTKLKYSGWGNFSETLLKGIEGYESENEHSQVDGEIMSIIDGLWNTNCNLMQLLSSRFTFSKNIEVFNQQRTATISKITYENVVEPLFTSPSNKRAIWQTIQIAEEIKKVMGSEPKKIFIEMARGNKKGKDKDNNKNLSRKNRLIELYNNCYEDVHSWMDEDEKNSLIDRINNTDERQFNSKKLYLYYTQMGRCMYTGERIDLDELMMKNSKWDRDHIYPQSKIKDDSMDNLVLVNKKCNAKKSNELLSYDIVKKQRKWWGMLRKKGFISPEKYDRLTRTTDFTEEELAGFINRQLVETRQSSRLIADIFKNLYQNSNVIYVKASLASDFRKRQLNVLKSRLLNDYHHAKDAYLNIVVGNVYNAKFTSNPINWMKKNKNTNYSINRVFDYDVKDRQGNVVWHMPNKDDANKPVIENGGYVGGTIDIIRKIVNRNDILYTEYTYCEKGGLFDETLAKKDPNLKVPLKGNLDVGKYGGYKSAKTSYFTMIEFENKKGERARHIIGVPIYVANRLNHKPDALIRYCEDVIGYKEVKVITEKIKKNSLIIVDGFPMRIRGENEKNIILKAGLQLIVDNESAETIRCIEKFLDKEMDVEPNPVLDGISHDKLNKLYEVLNKKLKTNYKNRPSNISRHLDKGYECFVNLEKLSEKSKIINEIMNSLKCNNANTSNLKLIGAGANVGSMDVNKNTIANSNFKIVNQSITGLFEN